MESNFSFAAEFTGPYELRAETPRRALLTWTGIQMALTGTVLLAFAAAGAVWVFRYNTQQTQRDSALGHGGQRAQGAITELQSSGPFEPRVDYTFTVGGASYTGQARVPASLVHTLADSASLPVLYLPANPAINHPAGWQPSPNSALAMLAAPAISALLGLLLFVPLFMEQRIATEGTPVLATITKCTRARSGYLLNYAFQLENGKAVKGHGWYETWQEPGTGIWALYLPRHPRRNLPYPLSYCRVLR